MQLTTCVDARILHVVSLLSVGCHLIGFTLSYYPLALPLYSLSSWLVLQYRLLKGKLQDGESAQLVQHWAVTVLRLVIKGWWLEGSGIPCKWGNPIETKTRRGWLSEVWGFHYFPSVFHKVDNIDIIFQLILINFALTQSVTMVVRIILANLSLGEGRLSGIQKP